MLKGVHGQINRVVNLRSTHSSRQSKDETEGTCFEAVSLVDVFACVVAGRDGCWREVVLEVGVELITVDSRTLQPLLQCVICLLFTLTQNLPPTRRPLQTEQCRQLAVNILSVPTLLSDITTDTKPCSI